MMSSKRLICLREITVLFMFFFSSESAGDLASQSKGQLVLYSGMPRCLSGLRILSQSDDISRVAV